MPTCEAAGQEWSGQLEGAIAGVVARSGLVDAGLRAVGDPRQLRGDPARGGGGEPGEFAGGVGAGQAQVEGDCRCRRRDWPARRRASGARAPEGQGPSGPAVIWKESSGLAFAPSGVVQGVNLVVVA